MVSFSKASSWVLESSARIRDVCVYGRGDPKQVLYLSASQVVVFLQISSNMVPFGDNAAQQPDSQEAQSIQEKPTMGLQPREDILTGEIQPCKEKICLYILYK